MNTINLSEISKRAIQSFVDRREEYLQKVAHTSHLEEQARSLENKIDELSEALRRARSDYSEAKNSYITTGNMEAVTRTLARVQNLERELNLAQSVLPLADSAWKDSDKRDGLFIPQPPYAELSSELLAGLPDELGFALWLYQKAYGRPKFHDGSGRWTTLIDRLTKDASKYESQLKAMIAAATA